MVQYIVGHTGRLAFTIIYYFYNTSTQLIPDYGVIFFENRWILFQPMEQTEKSLFTEVVTEEHHVTPSKEVPLGINHP